MKHELEDQLRAGVRRELRDPPPALAARVRAQLGQAPLPRSVPAREFPFGLLAGLAAAGLLATAFWPEESAPATDGTPIVSEPAAQSAPELAIEWTRKGIAFASRIDRPLADEWQLIVGDSLRIYGSLLGQLPNLPR
jgi:hypothetical protein